MGWLGNSLWEVFDSPFEMSSLLHLLTLLDLLKICDNHQGNPGVLMPQIREFSTDVKVLENTFERRESGAHRATSPRLNNERAHTVQELTFSLTLKMIFKEILSSPEAQLRSHLGFQLRRPLSKSLKKYTGILVSNALVC